MLGMTREEGMVDVTTEGMNARDDKRVLTTKKLTYYDKERNSKVYRQLIASIASAILTALGTTSCMGV